MKQKNLCILLLISLLAGLFACGGETGTTGEDDAAENPKEVQALPTEGLHFEEIEDGNAYMPVGIDEAEATEIIVPAIYQSRPVRKRYQNRKLFFRRMQRAGNGGVCRPIKLGGAPGECLEICACG